MTVTITVNADKPTSGGKYILISFTPLNPGTDDQRYHVYGHISLGVNEQIAICDNKAQALAEAFKYRCPVWQGNGYELVLEKLSGVEALC